MNTGIQFILVFAILISIHELGHYLGYMLMGYGRPTIGYNWYSLYVGNKELWRKVTGRDACIILYIGVACGIVPFLFVNSPHTILYASIYLMISTGDLLQMFSLLSNWKEYRTMTLKEIAYREYKNFVS